jgi:lipoprotein-anchoring transpeptidase ErfK/SrfK
LHGAVLDYADFAGADLSQSDLSGARLHNVRNLLRAQIEETLGDAATILPSHLRGSVPWSAVGDEPEIPLLDAEFWLLQARRDLRGRTFYGQTMRVAGALAVGAAVATGFVTETAHDTLPPGPTEAQKSVEPTLSVLPAMEEQASAVSMPAATGLEAAASPPSLATVLADLVRPAAPAPSAIVEPEDAAVPSEAADPPSETISEIAGAMVVSVPAAGPVTLTLASATLSPLKPRQSAVVELRTRVPKIPALLRAPLRLKVVKQARVIMPVVAAFDDPKAPAPATAAADVPEPMMLVVSLDAQKLDIYRGLKHVASAKISSGMPGYDTKMGVFSILEKKRRHHSNLYSGAPMPFMHRLTRSGTALHAGAIPGYPASHGCVRLPYSFAPKLFEMTSVGQNVVVTRGRPVPTPIEHPNLFELPPPKPQVAMAASVAVPRLLTDAVAVAAKSEVENHAVAAFRSDAPLRMLVTRRTAHDRVMAVQYMLADLGYLARQNFIGNLGPATGSAIRAFQKANGFPVTGAFTDELASQVYRAAGKTEPPEGHLFVRQGFKRVFDLPISFRDPAVPLGTHVFSVVKRGGGEAKPEWMAVSLEGGDAANVLDRIDVPDDVRRSIAPLLTPGSTLIVADKSEYSAILPEGDDFLVSTAEQAAAEDAKVEQASARPDEVARPKRRSPRSGRRVRPLWRGRGATTCPAARSGAVISAGHRPSVCPISSGARNSNRFRLK